MRVRASALIVFAACSGGEKLDGSIHGASFSISSTAAQAAVGSFSFVLSSADNICADFAGTTGEPDSQNLAAALRNTDGSGAPQPISAGGYAIGATTGMYASVHYASYGDNCGSPTVTDATGGAITVTAIDPTTGIGAGKLELDFGSDHLSGSFSTSTCPTLGVVRCVPQPQ